MAMGLYFSPEGFTVAKYDEALEKLKEAGAGSPPGRSYHVALETDGNIHVFDIWESQETFEAFGQSLLPIMSALGVDPGKPAIATIHNVIEG